MNDKELGYEKTLEEEEEENIEEEVATGSTGDDESEVPDEGEE